VQQAVYHHARGAGLHGLAVAVLELAQNLRLAHDHGIEAGGHAEQVRHGVEPLVRVGVGAQNVQRPLAGSGPVGQQGLLDVQALTAGAVGHDEDFHTVAGGKRHDLAHGTGFEQAFLEVRNAGEGELLAHVHSGGAVVESDKENVFIHYGLNPWNVVETRKLMPIMDKTMSRNTAMVMTAGLRPRQP